MPDLLVTRMTWEADGVLSVRLADPSGAPLPPWEPGAHVELDLGGLRRQYSLCGPADGSYTVAVLAAPGGRGGSRYVHETLRPGRRIPVGPVRNTFPLVDAPRYAFVAGGIGITPLLPMIAAVHARGRPWTLHFTGRDRGRMPFLAGLAPYGDRVTSWCSGERGRLPLDFLAGTGPDTAVYCCGPEPLLAAVLERCPRARVERFGNPLAVGTAADVAFPVRCARAGVSTVVGATETVLDALARAGVELDSDCREGTCGSCETPVLSGDLVHRDALLADDERAAGRTMMPCVSRARGPLVLDA